MISADGCTLILILPKRFGFRPPEFELLLASIRSVAIEVVPRARTCGHGPGDWILCRANRTLMRELCAGGSGFRQWALCTQTYARPGGHQYRLHDVVIAELGAVLDDIARETQATFGGLDAQQLNWRPDAKRWSVGSASSICSRRIA